MTRKWNIANDNSDAHYDVGNEIIYNTEVVKSFWLQRCLHFSKRWYTVTATPATQVAFKNFVPFTKCITKIDEKTIDDAEDLDLLMPMYNLREYSSNYTETTGSSWFYSKDEVTNFNADIELM